MTCSPQWLVNSSITTSCLLLLFDDQPANKDKPLMAFWKSFQTALRSVSKPLKWSFPFSPSRTIKAALYLKGSDWKVYIDFSIKKNSRDKEDRGCIWNLNSCLHSLIHYTRVFIDYIYGDYSTSAMWDSILDSDHFLM